MEVFHEKYLTKMRHVDLRFLVLTFAPLSNGIKMKYFGMESLLGFEDHDEEEKKMLQVWREERNWRYGNGEEETDAEVVARDAWRVRGAGE
jgi:hypothetical protein